MFSWLLTAIATIVFLLTRKYLPPELKSYLEGRKTAPLSSIDTILLWVDVGLLLVAIIISIGLFFFKKWAKKLLLISYVITLSLIPARDVYIETGWAELFFTLSTIIGGMILALAYYSPVAEAFETGDNQVSRPA